MNILKPFLNPKKLRKLQNNPQMFFKDALDKRIIPIQNQLKHLKPKKKHAFAEYYIISAVYNVEKYLEDYFNSILKQRLDFKNNIKIICVDDGSTDKSAEIIKNYQKKFPKNIVYLYKENGGQASARNLGLQWLQEQLGCLEGISADTTQPQKSDIMDLRSAGKLLRSVRHDSLMTESYQMRHCEARSNEAIHNVSNPKIFNGEISDNGLPRDSNESLAMTESPQKSDIMDCHENQRFSRNDGGADALDSRHCEARSNEAIHNVSNPKIFNGEISDNGLPQPLTRLRKDANLNPQKSDIMDCHENQRFSRNDGGADALDSRHCEARSNEAIHNVSNPKIFNGEISDNGLPRDSNESLAMTEGQTLDYGLPQPLTRLRNDANLNPQKSDIMDCHENQRFSRNDAEVSILESRKDSNQPIWVTFTDPDDFLDRDYFYEVDRFLEENQEKDICMVGCNATLFLEKEKAYRNHPLHHFIFIKEIVKVSDLNNEIKMPNSTFYQMLSLKVNKIYFNEKVNYFEDALFSLTYLDSCKGNSYCGFLENAKYYLRKRESANSTQDKKMQDKKYYLDTLKFNILNALTMNQSLITQNSCFAALLYYVREIIEQDRTPLNTDERLEFLGLLDQAFSLINNDVILKFNALGNSPMYKMGILYCFKGEASFPNCVEVRKYDAIREEILISYYTPNPKEVESIIFDGRESWADYEKVVRYDFLGRDFVYEKRLWIKLLNNASELEILIRGRRCAIRYGGKTFQKLQLVWLFNKFATLKKEYINNDIWLFVDRDIEADDNAEYLYRYVRKANPNQKIYFALMRESLDWDRLSKEGFNLVECYSVEFFNIARKAKFFITSHTPQTFGVSLKEWQKFLCLGHGVDFVEISRWFNTLNISCRFSSIQREYESIVRNESRYNLTSKECALTGQARWDSLLKNNQINNRQILIMPTWRLYLTFREKTLLRGLNNDFLQSQYYIYWNSLLHSSELKQLAETYHYSVLFCPHFNMMKMLDYFDIPEYIKVGYRKDNEPFQKIFQTSDLMITDYTSAASEMAYLKKPVLYYQFDEEEFFANHSYRKGWFDYCRDGFGPVVATEEELLKELEILLQNDCKVGEPYQSNIENTFEFRDGKCCERIYKAILELDKPYERKWTLDSVLRLAQNALNHQCYKEASERFRFVLEHLGENGEVGLTSLSLRGANEMRDEAIYNVESRNDAKGLRNDTGADASDSRHCERSEAIHNVAYFKDSIAKTKGETSDNGLPRDSNESLAMTENPQKSDIIDCHENQRFSRNDTGASVSESRHCEDDRTKQSIMRNLAMTQSPQMRHCEQSEAIHNVAQKALSEFRTSEVVLNEEIIFNYLYASRLNQTSQEALEFLKAQGYESRFAFSNQVKFEIIKNYIEILDAQEVIARLEDLRERIPPQELLEFAYLKLRIYAYLGDKQKLKEVYNELKNTYNIDKKDLDLDLFLFQNELIKAASLQAASTSAGGGGIPCFISY